VHRCSHLAAWAAALGWEPRGDGHGRLKARVQQLQGCLVAEELYPSRLTYGWRAPDPHASLLLVQHGRCLAEGAGTLLMLRAGGRNVGLLPPASVCRFTVSQAPCRLVRIVLPASYSHPGPGTWSVDLSLMLPMLRLLEQALRHPGGEERRAELASTLFGYLWHQLGAAGCVMSPTDANTEGDSPGELEAELLPRLERWLAPRLEQPLQLVDLARAMALSPRRLQELCKEQAGCTPMEFLRRQRLDLLAHLLRQPDLGQQSIAFLLRQSGLADSLATNREFRRRFGCALADYRQSLLTHQ
jgi:AraC-like DNA-binding protein